MAKMNIKQWKKSMIYGESIAQWRGKYYQILCFTQFLSYNYFTFFSLYSVVFISIYSGRTRGHFTLIDQR